ncbi:MAG: hypothetical protein IJC37_06820 [Clostridia bacterium]|nr:hypothetical protein [Clostridia bacterium]
MKKIRIASLILFVITTVISIDLLFNLLGNIDPAKNDGLGMFSIIIPGHVYFGDSLWSLERFYDAFVTSALVSLAVFIENIILSIIAIAKSEK